MNLSYTKLWCLNLQGNKMLLKTTYIQTFCCQLMSILKRFLIYLSDNKCLNVKYRHLNTKSIINKSINNLPLVSLSRRRCIWMRLWWFSSFDTQECLKLFASGGQATEPSTHSRYCKVTLLNPAVILDIRFWPIISATYALTQKGRPIFHLYYLSCLQEFVDQFRVLLPKDTTAFKEDISELLEKKMGLDPTTYQIGKTKVQH